MNQNCALLLLICFLLGLNDNYVSALAFDGLKINFKELAKRGIAENPSLKMSENQVKKADLAYYDSLSAFLPNLSASATLGSNAVNSIGGPSSSSASRPLTNIFGLTLSETLYNNGLNWTQFKVAQKQKEQSLKIYERERNQFLLDLWKAYLSYCMQSLQLEMAQEQLGFWQVQFKTVEKQYRQGLKLQSDYLRTKAQFNRSQISVMAAAQQISAQKNSILAQAGILKTSELSPELSQKSEEQNSGPNPLTLDLEMWKPRPMPKSWPKEELLWNETLEGQLQEIKLEIQKMQIDQAFRLWLPQVNVAVNAGYNNYDILGLGQNKFAPVGAANLNAFNSSQANWTWNAGVSITWNIWDWKTSYRQYEGAQIDLENAHWGQKTTKLNQMSTWTNLMNELQRLAAVYGLQEELSKIDRTSFDQIQEDYKLGNVGYLEVQTAAQNWYGSKANLSQAFYDYESQIYNYYFWKNKIYEAVFK